MRTATWTLLATAAGLGILAGVCGLYGFRQFCYTFLGAAIWLLVVAVCAQIAAPHQVELQQPASDAEENR